VARVTNEEVVCEEDVTISAFSAPIEDNRRRIDPAVKSVELSTGTARTPEAILLLI
jgi:hypothetical protein